MWYLLISRTHKVRRKTPQVPPAEGAIPCLTYFHISLLATDSLYSWDWSPITSIHIPWYPSSCSISSFIPIPFPFSFQVLLSLYNFLPFFLLLSSCNQTAAPGGPLLHWNKQKWPEKVQGAVPKCEGWAWKCPFQWWVATSIGRVLPAVQTAGALGPDHSKEKFWPFPSIFLGWAFLALERQLWLFVQASWKQPEAVLRQAHTAHVIAASVLYFLYIP